MLRQSAVLVYLKKPCWWKESITVETIEPDGEELKEDAVVDRIGDGRRQIVEAEIMIP